MLEHYFSNLFKYRFYIIVLFKIRRSDIISIEIRLKRNSQMSVKAEPNVPSFLWVRKENQSFLHGRNFIL